MSGTTGESQGSNGAYRSPPMAGESERLLDLAEKLQAKRDETTTRIWGQERTDQVLALVTVALTFGIGLVVWNYMREISIAVIAGVAVFMFLVALYTARSRSSLAVMKSSLRRDERALFEVVDLLRETQKSLADSEHWSKLQEAEFRIRLARFDIGSGAGEATTQGGGSARSQ